jgi:16S rRNA (uracil1498-N3)-methyltransferase
VSRRFFVAPGAIDGDRVELDGALAHRVATVLRLRKGDEIVLFDGSGREARATIESAAPSRVTAGLVATYEGRPEPRVGVHLYAAIPKAERFDWLVEKATEIGVARIVPLLTERSVVRSREGGRADRWRRIAVEAAEQCGRSIVPEISAPARFDEALAEAPGVRLLPYESLDPNGPTIADALDRQIDAFFAMAATSIFIGPEGGFTDDEVTHARAAGAEAVTLGRRILRAETAGIVAATLVLHAAAEL